MKKTNIILCGSSYEAPAVRVLDIMSEGVLCSSFDVPGYGYDNENDLGEI